jgi:hypothetical protein
MRSEKPSICPSWSHFVSGLKFNCLFSLIVQFFGESDVTFGGKLWVYGCWLVGTFASMRKPVLLNIIQLHKESYNEAVTLRELWACLHC